MNRKEKLLKRNGNWRLYHTPGMPNYAKRKRNCVFISPANSWEHEKTKCLLAYMLRQRKHDYITEAVSNKTGERHDLIDLDTGWIYEVETDKKRAGRFKNRDEIIVVKLWEGKKISYYLDTL